MVIFWVIRHVLASVGVDALAKFDTSPLHQFLRGPCNIPKLSVVPRMVARFLHELSSINVVKCDGGSYIFVDSRLILPDVTGHAWSSVYLAAH